MSSSWHKMRMYAKADTPSPRSLFVTFWLTPPSPRYIEVVIHQSSDILSQAEPSAPIYQ